MKKDKFEEYDNQRKLLKEWGVQQYRLQDELIRGILSDGNELCGLLGTVTGENGTFQVESIYLEDENGDPESEIMCHLNYPAFEIDAPFEDFSIWERQQMIELVFKLLKDFENSDKTNDRIVKRKKQRK